MISGNVHKHLTALYIFIFFFVEAVALANTCKHSQLYGQPDTHEVKRVTSDTCQSLLALLNTHTMYVVSVHSAFQTYFILPSNLPEDAGFASRQREEICFPSKHSGRLRGPPSLTFNGYRVCFPGVKWQGPIPVAARSKTWVCGRSLAGIVGSNPA